MSLSVTTEGDLLQGTDIDGVLLFEFLLDGGGEGEGVSATCRWADVVLFASVAEIVFIGVFAFAHLWRQNLFYVLPQSLVKLDIDCKEANRIASCLWICQFCQIFHNHDK